MSKRHSLKHLHKGVKDTMKHVKIINRPYMFMDSFLLNRILRAGKVKYMHDGIIKTVSIHDKEGNKEKRLLTLERAYRN